MRFRKYLGEQYKKDENAYTEIVNEKEIGRAVPLLRIYFPGHKPDHTEAPVIKIQRNYYDMTTGKEITQREEFIESLSHDSFSFPLKKVRSDPDPGL